MSSENRQECSDVHEQAWCQTFVNEKASNGLDLRGAPFYEYKHTELISINDATAQTFYFSFGHHGVAPPTGSVSYVYVNNDKFGPYEHDTDIDERWFIDCDSQCDCLVGRDTYYAS